MLIITRKLRTAAIIHLSSGQVIDIDNLDDNNNYNK